MVWPLIVIWAVAVASFTLLGSLYARRLGRPDMLIGLYVAFVITAQILATKVAQFDLGLGTFTASAGILVFSVTFLLADIINERFGRKETQRVIFIALVAQIAMAFFVWLGTQFASDPLWSVQGAKWDDIFLVAPRITFATWIAYFVSENLDAYIYAWFNEWTHGRHLWMRNVFSSLPALAVDSVIFVPIVFWGAPLGFILLIIKGQVLIKWVVGVISIPFMYMNRAILLHKTDTPDLIVWGEKDEELPHMI
jgi:uncharacterized integral membrane protein (TIGR00697 family)